MGSHDCIPSPVYPGLHAQALCYYNTSVINDHILCDKLTNPGPVITHLALRSQPPLLALTQGSNAACNNNALILLLLLGLVVHIRKHTIPSPVYRSGGHTHLRPPGAVGSDSQVAMGSHPPLSMQTSITTSGIMGWG